MRLAFVPWIVPQIEDLLSSPLPMCWKCGLQLAADCLSCLTGQGPSDWWCPRYYGGHSHRVRLVGISARSSFVFWGEGRGLASLLYRQSLKDTCISLPKQPISPHATWLRIRSAWNEDIVFLQDFASSASKPFPCERRISGPRSPCLSRAFWNNACPWFKPVGNTATSKRDPLDRKLPFLTTWVVSLVVRLVRPSFALAWTFGTTVSF